MNYCQFRNDVIKRMANGGAKPILPPEYQQVEYLQSTGTQYINIGPVVNHQFYNVDFTWNNFVNNIGGQYSVNGFLGINSYGDQDVKCWLRKDMQIRTNFGSITAGYTTIAQQTRYTMYFSPTQFIIDDVDYATGSGQFSSSVDCYIFSVHVRDASANQWGCAVKIYSLQTSSIDLYPCYRKSDNKPGMYDLISDTFFTNAGTGEFTLGNNV